jgi:uncharacterized repeat protein (TIGR02543 family)
MKKYLLLLILIFMSFVFTTQVVQADYGTPSIDSTMPVYYNAKVADINNDGFEDIVYGDADLYLQLGSENGLSEPQLLKSLVDDDSILDIEIGDLDGLYNLDIVFTTDLGVYILLSALSHDGIEYLTKFSVNYGAGNFVQAALADIDNDADTDIVYSLYNSSGSTLGLLTNSAGNFTNSTQSISAVTPKSIDVDLDQPDSVRVVLSTSSKQVVQLYDFNGTNFTQNTVIPDTMFSVIYSGNQVKTFDYNNDGLTDIMSLENGGTDILYKNSDGTYGRLTLSGGAGHTGLEILYGSGSNKLLVEYVNFSALQFRVLTGSIYSGYTPFILNEVIAGVVKVFEYDLDHDGDKEIIVSIDGGTKIFNNNAISSQTITFYNEDSSEYDSQTINSGSSITFPVDPTKTGYTFDGWYSDAELTTAFTATTMPNNTVNLYPKFTADPYQVYYYDSFGEIIQTDTYGFQEDLTEVTMPSVPSLDGYTCNTWDGTLPNTMPMEVIVYRPVCTINQFTVTFDSDGGTAVEAITDDFNSEITAPTAPTKTGFTFSHWTLDNEIFTFERMPSTNLTLVALYTPNTYTLTFDTTGGTAVAPIEAEYNSDIIAPSDPSKLGYTFDGWYSDSEYTNLFTFVTMGLDQVIYAKWNVNSYTITFDSNGGTEVDAITDDYQAIINAPSIPSKVGYQFDGWYTDNTFTQPFSFTSMPSEDLSLIAKWSLLTFTVSYDFNGVITTESVNYGDSLSQIPTPTKEGYSFSHWSDGTDEVTLQDYVQNLETFTFVAVFVDDIAPEITANKEIVVTLGRGINLNDYFTVTDLGSGVASYTLSEPFKAVTTGDYIISVIATDQAGNTTTESFPVTVVANELGLWIVTIIGSIGVLLTAVFRRK